MIPTCNTNTVRVVPGRHTVTVSYKYALTLSESLVIDAASHRLLSKHLHELLLHSHGLSEEDDAQREEAQNGSEQG